MINNIILPSGTLVLNMIEVYKTIQRVVNDKGVISDYFHFAKNAQAQGQMAKVINWSSLSAHFAELLIAIHDSEQWSCASYAVDDWWKTPPYEMGLLSDFCKKQVQQVVESSHPRPTTNLTHVQAMSVTAEINARYKVLVEAGASRVLEHVYGRADMSDKNWLQAISDSCGLYAPPTDGCWLRVLPARNSLGLENFPPRQYEFKNRLKPGETLEPGTPGETPESTEGHERIGGYLGKELNHPELLLGPVLEIVPAMYAGSPSIMARLPS
jgi:hypothetical protein